MILPQGDPASKHGEGENHERIHKVQKGASFHEVTAVDSVPPIQNIHSAFQMAEYLNLLVQRDPHNIARIVEVPDYHSRKSSDAPSSMAVPQGKEQDLWIYEHLRRLPIDLTPLTVSLLRECTPQTCPEMKAGEWQYICVANHQARMEEEGRGAMQENHCCAIDYILHTLDSHTALWNSSQAFPSRISIKPGSERYFGTQSRRISRIFSHAWYAHREIFEEAEAETSLYKRFVALVKRYELMNLSLLVIPGDAYDTSSIINGSAISPTKGQASRKDTSPSQQKHTTSGAPNPKTSAPDTETSNGKTSEKGKQEDSKKESRNEEDDADFRRDRFATPVTATRIGHGMRDILGGDDTGTSKGTLGRGRGKGIRKALFPVDVPAEEEEDEVDIHVEHVGIMSTDENRKDGVLKAAEEADNQLSTRGAEGTDAKPVVGGEPDTPSLPQNVVNGNDEREDDEGKAEPNVTADGVEFNV